MIYFTSDLHFNHDREFIYGPRGFKSVDEMNETEITNWNNTVTNEDDIYVLGDFFLGTNHEFIINTLNQLKGRIHLIIGNHDSDAKLNLYKQCSNIVEIAYATVIKYKNRLYYLSHYPTLTANLDNDPNRAIFNLFGHTHSKDKFYEDRPYMYNVACDAHNSTPVSIETINNDIYNKINECLSYL